MAAEYSGETCCACELEASSCMRLVAVAEDEPADEVPSKQFVDCVDIDDDWFVCNAEAVSLPSVVGPALLPEAAARFEDSSWWPGAKWSV